jgi:hypothetical protein
MVAPCGCPYDPEYDEDSLGWHLRENHIEDGFDDVFGSLELVREALEGLRTVSPPALVQRLKWRARQPTAEECRQAGRNPAYAEPFDDPRGWGDFVVETGGDLDARAKLAEALEAFGLCDEAHVIPTGVYLEE